MNGGPGVEPALRFASVVLLDGAMVHRDRLFTYSIPRDLPIVVGSMVRVPVRGKRTMGAVVDLLDQADVAKTVPIHSIVGPGLPDDVVSLARWTADRYLSSLGEALSTAAPARVASEERAARGDVAVPAVDRGADPLAGLDGGRALGAALEGGGYHGFVVRPPAEGPRGPLIVQMVDRAVRSGGSVLVLLPEVALQSDVAEHLDGAFGDAIAWLGSDRAPRERYRAWLALRRGQKQIAVGGRTAVFAPLVKCAAIIVDDEGHPSYKDGRAPRFHARTIAVERARRCAVPVILVGVPPSGEARAALASGAFRAANPSRVAERKARPPVTVIDRSVQDSGHTPTPATVTICSRARQEGRRVVVLTHRASDLRTMSERVGRALRAPVVVLTASTDHEALRAAVASAPVIIATPVIAKDMAIEQVGVLAILDADAALSGPEFRGPEETFATWWRAARWADRLVIETAEPTHPAIRSLTRWDPDLLWESDATKRKELGYPPFASLARIDVPAESAEETAAAVRDLGLTVLGPAERDGRTVVIVRAERRDDLLDGMRPLAARWRAEGAPMRIDIDPWEVFAPRWRS